jgi:WD40 repeat protein
VLAQQTAVQSDISRQSNDDPDRNVLLSVESLKRALTPEGYVSWERGMDLLPHPFERQFESIKHDISSIAYSPDGKLLAEGARDGTVIVQRTNQTGRALELQPKFTNAVSTITFGSDGSWFAAASQTEIKTWDTKFLKVIREGRMDNGPCCPQRVAFSPDGRYAAMGDPSMGPRVRVIDLVNSSTVVQAQLESVSYVMGVSFSPNGKWLAISCHENGKGKVILWDVSRFAKRIEGSPDSIASVTDSELIGAIVFSPKGNYLATPLFNGNIIWSIAYDEGVPKFSKLDSSKEMKEAGRSLVFSPDEKLIASVTNKDTIVWDVQTGREITRIRSAPFADIAFTPDSRLLTTASQDVRIWKLEFGSDAWRIPLHDESSEEKLTALAVSPGGEWLATGNTNGVSVFRTNDWSRIVNLRQAGNVSKLTFDSLGRWLISASDKEVNAFDTKQWKGVKVISLDADISFSPDGRWLVVTSGLDLKLFEYDTWREVLTMKHSDPVNKVFFSPDGGWLGVQSLGRYRWWSHHGYDDRKRTYIWDTSNGSPVACRTDTDISDRIEKESDTKDNRRLVCPEIKSNPQSALLAEVATWKATLQFNQRTVTRDGLWSGEYVDGIQLRLKEGIGARYVATFPSGPSTKDFTFTPDNRWIVVASDKYFTIWPLKPADMIEVACGRLRRRDLSADEWKRYFSGEKVEPTCASKQR